MLKRRAGAGRVPATGVALLPATAGLLAVCALFPVSALAQEPALLQGVIADAETRRLISSATVSVPEAGLEVRTGPDGGFAFPMVPLGPVSVRVAAPGYGSVVHEVEVREQQVTFLQVLLGQVEGEASLRIRVTDGATGRPVPGARVALPDLDRLTLSNAGGEASVMGIPPGEHRLEVTMLGYGPAEALVGFEPGSAAEGEVQLGTRPIELEGITVTGSAGITVTGSARWSRYLDRRGFYRRASVGLGRHLDRTDIEEMNAFHPSDLFRGMPGVRLVPTGFGRYALMGRRGFGGFGSSGGCRMSLYVDGVPWPEEIDDLPITWIEGVEVYTGVSQIPAEYSRLGSACGVVLIWTG